MRSGQIKHLFLFLLMPIILLTGIVLVNSTGKTVSKTFASKPFAAIPPETEDKKITEALCVLEDNVKFSILLFGASAGAIIGFFFMLEESTLFAKKDNFRKFGYMVTSVLVSACISPQILMSAWNVQPKALCLIVGAGVSFFSWAILEFLYPRVKGYISYLLDRFLPIPKQTDNSINTSMVGGTPQPPSRTPTPVPKLLLTKDKVIEGQADLSHH